MDETRFSPAGLVKSARYGETMDDVVIPYLKARGEAFTVRGAGDKPVHGVLYRGEGARGTVVFVHGFTENGFKFSELAYSLMMNGFDAVVYDQRGHGLSWRDEKVLSDMSLTHVERFSDYVEDLKRVTEYVRSRVSEPLMVFSHSMGGAVTGLFLMKYPGVFKRAVFCAPMIAPRRMGLPLWTAKAICRTAKLCGQGKKRMMFGKPYAGPEDFDTSCATGRERFDWYDAVKQAHEEYHNNGPTYGWTLEALNVTESLLAPGAPEKITIPVRVYSAENDGSVLPEGQKLFAGRLKNGTLEKVPGSRHEIYRSTDEVLFPWWDEILEFFKRETLGA